MKTKMLFAVLLAVLAFPVATLVADEPVQQPMSARERLEEVDLRVLLKLYEKVTTQCHEIGLEGKLSEAEQTKLSEKETQTRNRKLQVLDEERIVLRDQILALGERMEKRMNHKSTEKTDK